MEFASGLPWGPRDWSRWRKRRHSAWHFVWRILGLRLGPPLVACWRNWNSRYTPSHPGRAPSAEELARDAVQKSHASRPGRQGLALLSSLNSRSSPAPSLPHRRLPPTLLPPQLCRRKSRDSLGSAPAMVIPSRPAWRRWKHTRRVTCGMRVMRAIWNEGFLRELARRRKHSNKTRMRPVLPMGEGLD